MAAGFFGSSSKRALIALAFPLAALVPLAAPFDAAQVGSAGLSSSLAPLGQAGAATVKKAKKRKVVVRRSVTSKQVCTVTKVKGRKVTKCKTAKFAPMPPLAVTPVIPPHVPYIEPVHVPPPMPLAPTYAAQPAINPADYYWIDQADSLAQAFGNSPPDFTFPCGGIDCWTWVSRDGEVLIVEPGRSGVQQYFFAAQQSAPYLVRDSYNAFAFDRRELAVVYSSDGRIYPYAVSGRDHEVADALRERGRALYAASMRQRRWDRGSATAWIGGYSSLGYYDGWNSGWNGAWRELPDWDRYDRDRGRRHPPRHLGDEHRDRDDARRRYDEWHRRGAPGAPPPTGNPAVTPTDGSTAPSAPRPPHDPGPAPQPAPQPAPPPAPQPGWQPQPPPVADAPPPVPSDAPTPRRERPRREIEPEPGAPPILMRPRPLAPQPPPVADAPLQPAQTWPDPVPGPANPPPAPVVAARPIPAYDPPPVVTPLVVTPPPPPPAPTPTPPPPPPPPPPPQDQIVTENPAGDTDRP